MVHFPASPRRGRCPTALAGVVGGAMIRTILCTQDHQLKERVDRAEIAALLADEANLL